MRRVICNRFMVNKTQTTKKKVMASWTNAKYPDVKGWERATHTRGPNDKLAGEKYYTYHPPNGDRKQLRSLKQVNKRMEQDLEQAEQAEQEDDDEVVVVTPVLPKPPVIDLTDEDDDVYHNVTIRITSGGGLHIKWNE